MTKSPQTFSKTQIYLHWLVVALVAFQYLLSEGINKLWKARMDGLVENVPSPNPHVIVGVIILVLVLWRLYLRSTRGVPPLPKSELPFVGMIAKAVHILFYVLLIGLPLSGAVAWFFGIKQSALSHGLGTKLLLAVIILHIAAALLHHFVLKTNVLKRMLGMK